MRVRAGTAIGLWLLSPGNKPLADVKAARAQWKLLDRDIRARRSELPFAYRQCEALRQVAEFVQQLHQSAEISYNVSMAARTEAAMPLVGSGFRLADLLGGALRDFTYEREPDAEIDRSVHYVVRATPVDGSEPRTGGGVRRHYVRKADHFLVRTDFHDARGFVVRCHRHGDVRLFRLPKL